MASEPGYMQDKEALRMRLRRIEGQVRGLQRMVEEDRYCIDVLTQVSAVKAALEGVALALVHDHVEHCLTDASHRGETAATARELTDAIGRLVRS